MSANQIPAAAVEIVARFYFDAAVRAKWEAIPSNSQRIWLNEARAALEAAMPYLNHQETR